MIKFAKLVAKLSDKYGYPTTEKPKKKKKATSTK